MPPSTSAPSREPAGLPWPLVISLIVAAAMAAGAQLPLIRGHEYLYPIVLAAAGFLVLWGGVLTLSARLAGRRLGIEKAIRRPHWVQACAQTAFFLYWGWHARTVYGFIPLMLVQFFFAYGVDALLNWSRRDTWRIGYGPLPIVFSIGLFLLFRPQWFYWQFVVILVGFLAKELIRWQRDGRSAHIFNPSSFPLGVASLVLLLTGTTDVTLGSYIAQSQNSAPHMYLVIFLVSIPGQLLFGVARMTVSAVVTMVAISGLHYAVTGLYMFPDAYIAVPVFLGMHLLVTDPSTSPRTEGGQILFGMLYAVGVTICYFVLTGLGLPAFYEKLLPVPIMNLMVRRIDTIVRSEALRRFDPARVARGLTPARRNVAYTGLWVGIFALFSSTTVLGDDHPGQYYPFWRDACEAGNEDACEYSAFMTYNYCERGSAWACNEYGVYLATRRYTDEARDMFGRACEGGFQPGCENARRVPSMRGTWARAAPRVEDLPIVLRGSKGPVRERDPATLLAMACEQGWPLCEDDGTD